MEIARQLDAVDTLLTHAEVLPDTLEVELAPVPRQAARRHCRDHTEPPAGQHLYPLRSRITCAQCQRRMCGLTVPGTTRSY